MQRITRLWSSTAARVVTVVLLVAALSGAAGITVLLKASAEHAMTACQLGSSDNNQVRHVIYLQFDNTHYNRDNPSVASDLQQMPHLLNFLTQNGTLFTNDHTILISHTAGGILSSLTGLYPDRNGQTVSNSYDYYRNNGVPTFTSSFKYWTSAVDGADDSKPNMVADTGLTTPAPWVPFTRAGCDVGGVGTANLEFENNTTDVSTIFGANSPEALEPPAQKTMDFVGIAIHCAKTATSACANSAHARPDALPDEPGGYTGYNALFGAKYVNPAIASNNCVSDTTGNTIMGSGSTGCGFPGFDGMLAKNSLGYVAQMQEAGVPVTYAYISDAHDNHTLSRASGPGEADYRQQLADYDAAFQSFFTRLQAHGIDKSNTLFVVTVDEGDHFAGGVGAPDGGANLVYDHNPCPQAPVASSCPSNQIGEVNAKIGSVLPAGEPGYDIHFDSAPTFYVNGDAAHPNGPDRTNPALRQLERDVSNATAPDPYAGGATKIAQRLADTVEEKTLHMINADQKRTPTFTMLGNPDFFFQTTNLSGGCSGSTVCVNPGFAWNHGDFQEEIGSTWVGIVGPGVQQNGVDSTTWTDHTNLRPTMLALLGLRDSYLDDGRVLIEGLTTQATPQALIAHRETVRRLGDIYEQVNAPFGQFAMDTLKASTTALGSNDAGDGAYTSVESQIVSLTAQRDTLASQVRSALNAAAFDGSALNEQQAKSWIDQANNLLGQAHTLAS
jgi:hypothetical protein